MTLLIAVAESWREWCLAYDLYRRDGATPDTLRRLVDASNEHRLALDAAMLAALKAGHIGVTERAKARAARSVRR